MTHDRLDNRDTQQKGAVHAAVDHATSITNPFDFIFRLDTDDCVHSQTRVELSTRGLKKYELRNRDFPSVDLIIPANIDNPTELIAQFLTRYISVTLFLELQNENIAHLIVVLEDTTHKYLDSQANYNSRTKTVFIKIDSLTRGNCIDHELVHHCTLSELEIVKVPRLLFEGLAMYVAYQLRSATDYTQGTQEDYPAALARIPDAVCDTFSIDSSTRNSLLDGCIGAALIELLLSQRAPSTTGEFIAKWRSMQWDATKTTSDFIRHLELNPAEIEALWKERIKGYKHQLSDSSTL